MNGAIALAFAIAFPIAYGTWLAWIVWGDDIRDRLRGRMRRREHELAAVARAELLTMFATEDGVREAQRVLTQAGMTGTEAAELIRAAAVASTSPPDPLH